MSDCAVISTAAAVADEKAEEKIMTVLDELLQYGNVVVKDDLPKENNEEVKEDEVEKADDEKEQIEEKKDAEEAEVKLEEGVLQKNDEVEKKDELEKNEEAVLEDKEAAEQKEELEPEDPKPEEEEHKEQADDEVQEADDLNKTMNTVERKTVKELREYYQLQNDLASKRKSQEEEMQFIDFDEVPLTPMQQGKEEKATQAPDADNSTPKKKKNPIGVALRRGLRWVNGKIRREKNYML